MIVWYNLYSYWIIGFTLLYILHLIQFSMIPSAIATFIVTVLFLIIKVYNRIPINFTYIFIQFIIHIFPFLIFPFTITQKDIFINSIIVTVYILWLKIQGLTVESLYTSYNEILHEDGRITLIEFMKRRQMI